MIKIFDTLEKYNVYTNNGQNLESGFLYFVKEDNSTHYYTNNIDGVATIYDSVETPSGNIEITENAESLDIAEYASATVNVPIPEGYIIPTGNVSISQNGNDIDVAQYATASVSVPQPTGSVSITQNGSDIDIAQYATANVNVPIPSGYIQPTGNISLTQNGTNIDIAQYATATVNVAGGAAKTYFVEGVEYDSTETGTNAYSITKLKHFLKNVIIPSGYTSIYNSAFLDADRLESVTIPNTITSIDYGVFANCTNLSRVNSNVNGECIIPNSVTTIGDVSGLQKGAFQYCESLTSLTIPNSVTGIGYQCFTYCTGLTSVTIGSGVTKISDGAFKNCTSLASITIEATTPPTLGSNALADTNANLVIYVPSESVDTYKAASGWSSYASRIQAIPT